MNAHGAIVVGYGEDAVASRLVVLFKLLGGVVAVGQGAVTMEICLVEPALLWAVDIYLIHFLFSKCNAVGNQGYFIPINSRCQPPG